MEHSFIIAKYIVKAYKFSINSSVFAIRLSTNICMNKQHLNYKLRF